MFYVCGPKGFIKDKNPNQKGTFFTADMREAMGFTSFRAADDYAKSRLGETYYGIANTGWRSDPATTPHHFDVGQRVKVVRGPHGTMMPETVRAFLDEECCVIDVSLTFDNEWEYKVEFEYGLVRELTAKYLTQAQRNDERPSDWERVQDA